MKILIFEKFDESYLREEEWLISLSPVSRDLDDIAIEEKKPGEEIHKFILHNKTAIQDSQIVFVSLSNLSLGLQIAHHMRLTEEYRPLPILLFGDIEEPEIYKQQNDLSHICYTKGVRYFSMDGLNEEILLRTVEDLKKELNELLETDDTFRDGFLKKIVLREPDKIGRHSIANQWGAYRMAQVAGLDMQKFNYPKTLYFKYLLVQAQNPEEQKLAFPIGKKILFIDDNYQKGWKDCLEGLFGKGTIEAYVSWQEAEVKGEDKKIKDGKYDLIFLDFYLGERDRKGAGQDILEKIKGKKDKKGKQIYAGLNPVVPVIMFTASNKAWNMDKLYEAGADGYYVKEHPDNAHDADFSVENFKNFHKTIQNCLTKGELLRKYWVKIDEIEAKAIIIDKSGQLNKKRIQERLMMFLGLLKKAYEQTHFDKQTFFYSEWELAFLTLWSTLNEIQEVYYEKVKSTFDVTRYGGKWNPYQISGQNAQYTSKWHILGQPSDVYFEKINLSLRLNRTGGFITRDGELIYDSDINCYLSFDKNTPPYYKTRDISGNYQKAKTFQPDQRLAFQIAFLILEKKELKHSPKKNELLKNLKELNEFRNHLYLTHGEDTANADFSILYREERKLDPDLIKSDENWQKKIKQLFEIVYFLCTGQECVL